MSLLCIFNHTANAAKCYLRKVTWNQKYTWKSILKGLPDEDVYKERFLSKQVSTLKIQPCKLYNEKYMISSAQITNTETFALIAVLVFKLLSHKVLFINKKDNRNC